ncbi:hypothetical protein Tco_1248765 [Tanacetum coccineum]
MLHPTIYLESKMMKQAMTVKSMMTFPEKLFWESTPKMNLGKDIKVKKSKNEQKSTRNEETSTREILEANIESRIKTVVEKRQESKEKDKGNDHYTL